MSDEVTSKHVRGKIRAAVAAALESIAETGGRVFQARAWPLEKQDLPCWLVHVDGERIETRQTGRQAIQSREVQISVVALAAHSDAVEDELDDLTAVAEEVLFADSGIAALAREFQISATENALNADSSLVIGQTRLTFIAKIHAIPGAPRTRA
jgi:mannose-1-phosphate guanylyltransferase